MKPATYFLLTVKNDRVVVVYDGTHGGEITKVVDSSAAFGEFLRSKAAEAEVDVGALTVMCSSTMDFPREFTANAETIALATELRG